MYDVTCLVETTATDFAEWLQNHARTLAGRYYRVGPWLAGEVRMLPAERLSNAPHSSSRITLLIKGTYFERDETGLDRIEKHTGDLASFVLLPLGPGRLEVQATCESVAQYYFAELIGAISRRWPETTEAIRNGLFHIFQDMGTVRVYLDEPREFQPIQVFTFDGDARDVLRLVMGARKREWNTTRTANLSDQQYEFEGYLSVVPGAEAMYVIKLDVYVRRTFQLGYIHDRPERVVFHPDAGRIYLDQPQPGKSIASLHLEEHEPQRLLYEHFIIQMWRGWIEDWQTTRQPEAQENRPARPGGRPRYADDEWAYEQVNVKGREPVDVYREWFDRIGERAERLSDPRDSFKKAIRPRRKKGKKRD